MSLDSFCEILEIDKKKVLDRFSGNVNLYIKFVGKFVDDRNYQDLVEASRKGDQAQIEAYAHTLKGIAGNMGFDKLFDQCNRVVKAVRSNEYEECMVSAVAEEYDKIVSLIAEGVEA